MCTAYIAEKSDVQNSDRNHESCKLYIFGIIFLMSIYSFMFSLKDIFASLFCLFTKSKVKLRLKIDSR